jgi:hypothetical protein
LSPSMYLELRRSGDALSSVTANYPLRSPSALLVSSKHGLRPCDLVWNLNFKIGADNLVNLSFALEIDVRWDERWKDGESEDCPNL